MNTLADRITERSKELGVSVADIADACGVSQKAVYLWLSGKNKNLKHDHLFALSEALNVTPRWLALGEGPKTAAANRDAYSVALSRRESASDDRVKAGWERIALVFAKAATVVLFLGALVRPELAHATTIGQFNFAQIAQIFSPKSLREYALRVTDWIAGQIANLFDGRSFLTAAR